LRKNKKFFIPCTFQFLELSISNRWKIVVCNITFFKEAFQFPNGTDIDSVQRDLCADAHRQNSAIAEIMGKLDVTDVMKVVSKSEFDKNN